MAARAARRRCTNTSTNTLPQSRHFATRGCGCLRWRPTAGRRRAGSRGSSGSRRRDRLPDTRLWYGQPAPARRARARSSRRRSHGAAGGASGCVRRPRAGGVDAALALSRLSRRRQRCAMPRSPVPSTCGTPPPRSTGRFRTPPASRQFWPRGGHRGHRPRTGNSGTPPDGRCARR